MMGEDSGREEQELDWRQSETALNNVEVKMAQNLTALI